MVRNTALHAWIEQQEKFTRFTCEAMADLHAVGVIADPAVQARADSLDSDTLLSVSRCWN